MLKGLCFQELEFLYEPENLRLGTYSRMIWNFYFMKKSNIMCQILNFNPRTLYLETSVLPLGCCCFCVIVQLWKNVFAFAVYYIYIYIYLFIYKITIIKNFPERTLNFTSRKKRARENHCNGTLQQHFVPYVQICYQSLPHIEFVHQVSRAVSKG